MQKKTLVSWIGNTDLRASWGELHQGVGPIANAIQAIEPDELHLLSDHSKDASQQFVKWIREQGARNIKLWPQSLSGPTRFNEIYDAATTVLRSLGSDRPERHLVFHISPGTPAMAAVWILLAKTRFPAELIESSLECGVRTVSIPMDIAVDHVPPGDAEDSDKIRRLTQGLPPETPELGAIIHRCKAMKTVVAHARRVAVEDVPVLIQGESGTGKELFARAIHTSSSRSSGPFVEVNCGAIPSELVESEFFGHTKGAFTGASEAKKGYLESSHRGTLFLDEIGELPLSAQVKLLRALQERKVTRVGSSRSHSVDFRIIAATNRNLLQDVNSGRFREDLFHRLAVGVLQLPPLRERPGDLSLLIDHFMDQINASRAKKTISDSKKLSAGAKNLLLQHPWTGNIRELSNTLCRAAIWTPGSTIGTEQIRQALFPIAGEAPSADVILNRSLENGVSLPDLLAEVARHYLVRAFDAANGNKSEACKLIGLSNYQTFTNWMKKYGVGE